VTVWTAACLFGLCVVLFALALSRDTNDAKPSAVTGIDINRPGRSPAISSSDDRIATSTSPPLPAATVPATTEAPLAETAVSGEGVSHLPGQAAVAEDPPTAAESLPVASLPQDPAAWTLEDYNRAIAEKNVRFLDAVRLLGERSGGSEDKARQLAEILVRVSEMPDEAVDPGSFGFRTHSAASSVPMERPYSRSRPIFRNDLLDPTIFDATPFDPDAFRASSMKDVREALDRLRSQSGRRTEFIPFGKE
jgi:hypothetical protein